MVNNRELEGPFEANKAFKMDGVEYAPGDPVDTSAMPQYKIAQFLSQRFLRPSVARAVE